MQSEKPTWPPLVYPDWQDSCATLHMWTQIVGKIRLALAPPVNHWWHVPLYLTSRGLTTSPMPYGGRTFQIDFDFIDHVLRIETSDGRPHSFEWGPKSLFALPLNTRYRHFNGSGRERARLSAPGTVSKKPGADDRRHGLAYQFRWAPGGECDHSARR